MTTATLEAKPIPSVFSSQEELLAAIMQLHCPDGFELDPTYSKGIFYRGAVPQPRLRFDLAPQVNGVGQADCRQLPLDGESIASIMFDPPFLHHHGKDSRMGNRFSSMPSQRELRDMYADALTEFWRIMRPGGLLVFKCQDVVESGKQILTHCYVWSMAAALGFEDVDLFVLLAKRRMIGWNHGNQKHARKYHSYFLVFRKPRLGRKQTASAQSGAVA